MFTMIFLVNLLLEFKIKVFETADPVWPMKVQNCTRVQKIFIHEILVCFTTNLQLQFRFVIKNGRNPHETSYTRPFRVTHYKLECFVDPTDHAILNSGILNS